ELEATLDLDGACDRRAWGGSALGWLAHEDVILTQSPSKRCKSGFLHGVADNLALVEADESMGSGEDKGGLQADIPNLSHTGMCTVRGLGSAGTRSVRKAKSGNALNDKVFTRQSA